jgi:ATP-binding cassette subfamily A (ABC1) protein 3
MWACYACLIFYDVKPLIDGEAGEALIYLLLGYGAGMAGFCYVLSFGFKSHSSSQIFIIFASFIGGFMVGMASIVMSFITATIDLNNTLIQYYRLLPGFCFAHGLLAMVFAPIISLIDFSQKYDAWDGLSPVEKASTPEPAMVDFGPLHPQIAGTDIKYLLYESFVYVALAILIEYFLATPSLFAWITNAIYTVPPAPDFAEDNDVKAEADRVNAIANGRDSGNAKCEDAICVDNLTKVYPGGKFAVKGVSLGVPYGECFGLLGINGAGKTTTLSMLSGEFPPSKGRAWLANKNITTEANKVRRLIGYCPQFDALFELMTGYEHLRMYARIKGIAEHDIERCVEEQIVRMDLTDHCKRMAGGYSGGNKRKLSVACAMIGQPSIIFLDEPSTGMDPVARRFMWNVINDICHEGKTSVILTTHSMEECEALCQRIGIMVGGRFRCIGSGQHLKSKFGLGYQLEFVLKIPTPESTTEWHDRLKKENNGNDAQEMTMGDVKNVLIKIGKGSFCETVNWAGELHSGCSMHDLAVWCVTENSCHNLLEFMTTIYPGSVVRERQGLKLRYEVPHTIQGTKLRLSGMFKTMEKEKVRLNLQEYSLSQTSLEQVFNSFAAQQEEEQGPAVGMTKSSGGRQLSSVVHDDEVV